MKAGLILMLGALAGGAYVLTRHKTLDLKSATATELATEFVDATKAGDCARVQAVVFEFETRGKERLSQADVVRVLDVADEAQSKCPNINL